MLTAHSREATPARNYFKDRDISLEAESNALRTALHGRNAIDQRLKELDEEWDIESLLKLQAFAFVLKYAIFGRIISKKFYLVPALVGIFAIQQSATGWSPPFALYKKAGKRTASEIDDERQSLLAMKNRYPSVMRGH